MKIRTDFVTNSSSSNFCVSLTLCDKNGNNYCFYDDPYDYSPDGGGKAYFKGSLKQVLLEGWMDLESAFSRDYELRVKHEKKIIQAAEELHVGARLSLKEHFYRNDDWERYLSIDVFRNNNQLGEIGIMEYYDEEKGINVIHKALKSEKNDFTGVVTRIVPHNQMNSDDDTPLIDVRIIDETKESRESENDDNKLIFDTVKELCEFLMESIKDDYYDWDEDSEWNDDVHHLDASKKNFIKDVTSKVKNISDIKSISVQRDYSAWGEFSQLIADNDGERYSV